MIITTPPISVEVPIRVRCSARAPYVRLAYTRLARSRSHRRRSRVETQVGPTLRGRIDDAFAVEGGEQVEREPVRVEVSH